MCEGPQTGGDARGSAARALRARLKVDHGDPSADERVLARADEIAWTAAARKEPVVASPASNSQPSGRAHVLGLEGGLAPTIRLAFQAGGGDRKKSRCAMLASGDGVSSPTTNGFT